MSSFQKFGYTVLVHNINKNFKNRGMYFKKDFNKHECNLKTQKLQGCKNYITGVWKFFLTWRLYLPLKPERWILFCLRTWICNARKQNPSKDLVLSYQHVLWSVLVRSQEGFYYLPAWTSLQFLQIQSYYLKASLIMPL